MSTKPKKRFGQHFLTSQGAIANIIRLANVQKGDKILEIGPGKGALTSALLAAGAEVTAVELDPDMIEYISTHHPQVRLIAEDASKISWASVLEGGNWKCVSNLPYNVGTKIVKNLLLEGNLFQSLTVMLQKEVGLRMLAEKDHRKRGSLSSFVQVLSSVEKGFIVPPGAFFPPPKVDSIVISLLPREKPSFYPNSIDSFELVNRALFAQPRKAIRNSLRSAFAKEQIQELEKHAEFSFGLRPANLSNQEIVDLVTILEQITK